MSFIEIFLSIFRLKIMRNARATYIHIYRLGTFFIVFFKNIIDLKPYLGNFTKYQLYRLGTI